MAKEEGGWLKELLDDLQLPASWESWFDWIQVRYADLPPWAWWMREELVGASERFYRQVALGEEFTSRDLRRRRIFPTSGCCYVLEDFQKLGIVRKTTKRQVVGVGGKGRVRIVYERMA